MFGNVFVFEVWQWHGARGSMLCEREEMVLSPSTFGLKRDDSKLDLHGLRNEQGSSQEFPWKTLTYLWAMVRSERANVFPYNSVLQSPISSSIALWLLLSFLSVWE